MDENAEWPSKLFGKRQYGNAVSDTERMVGDDDKRLIRG
ncbi:hypothetical protein GGD56_006025 [Rhizobium mongolense]|uniref:Uncharacterized protein n=1 Tax=Rhizobium mongolense TaxID=57676 RepID=A0ABR6IW39_9HYPH|nr:hypothetical protein [Rhizobium mongolense]